MSLAAPKIHRTTAVARKIVGADESMFYKAFEDTPKVQISSPKELENEFARCMTTISNTSADWDRRVEALKRFRSLFNCGIADCDDLPSTLKALEISFQANLQDLRSQVVRETCITIAFLSCRLQQKFSRMAEVLFPSLIKLLPNSAKIVSTSASVTIRFIIQSSHSPRLIPIIKYHLINSKSKETHRALCEIVERIVHTWSAQILERCVNDLQEVIRLGICDSDEQARIYARRAFNGFADVFKDNAEQLYQSLGLQRQRMLNSENNLATMSNHGSTNSLNHGMTPYGTSGPTSLIARNVAAPETTGPKSTSSVSGSVENLYGFSSLLQKNIASRQVTAGAATRRTQPSDFGFNHSSTRVPYSNRSASVIDEAAQRRAKQRAYLSTIYHRPRPMPTPNSDLKPISKPVVDVPDSTKPNDNQLMSLLKSMVDYNSKTIGYLTERLESHSSHEIAEILDDLMPPLIKAYDHQQTTVRKAAVFAMVAIYRKVGKEKLEPHLTSLSSTKRKLLDFYIEKSNNITSNACA